MHRLLPVLSLLAACAEAELDSVPVDEIDRDIVAQVGAADHSPASIDDVRVPHVPVEGSRPILAIPTEPPRFVLARPAGAYQGTIDCPGGVALDLSLSLDAGPVAGSLDGVGRLEVGGEEQALFEVRAHQDFVAHQEAWAVLTFDASDCSADDRHIRCPDFDQAVFSQLSRHLIGKVGMPSPDRRLECSFDLVRVAE